MSLSSDGSIVAIGANGNDDNGTDSGHVRLYEWDGAAWAQRGDDIDGEAEGDQSGLSVSLSSDGSIVAIGATRQRRSNGVGLACPSLRVGRQRGQQKGDDIDGEAANDVSGSSVSLSADGSIVAIGAYLQRRNER